MSSAHLILFSTLYFMYDVFKLPSYLLIQIKSCLESSRNHFNEVVVFACCCLFILNIGLGKERF